MKVVKNIITVIAVFMIIAGIVCLSIGVNNGGKIFFGIDYANKKIVYPDDDIIEKTYDYDDFKNLEINVDCMKLTIKEGKEYKVACKYMDDFKPEIDLSGDTLKITQRLKDKSVTDFGRFLSVSKNGISFGSNILGNSVEITIPKGEKLDNIKINAKAGDVNLNSFEADEIKADLKAGDLKVSDINVDNMEFTLNAGDVKINKIEGKDFEIKMNAGDVNLSDGDFENVKIDMDAGDLDIDDTNADDFDIKLSSGDVDASFPGKEKDYNIDVKCSAGDLSIDGDDEHGNDYTSDNDADKDIVIKCSFGDIDVDFD